MDPKKSIETDSSFFERTQGRQTAGLFSFWLTIGALVITLWVSAFAMSQSAGRNSAQRIRFAIGAVSAQTPGQFTPANERVRYVIKAKTGDHMIVNIIPVTKTLTMAGTIKTPSGEGDGGPGGIIMNSDLTESGDYTIEVFQHTMGSNLPSGRFILEVVITPAWLKS
ncbi:MAG TPA: hypothetical protein VIF64_04470 [Pyrinomonadaceae bacterium]|jgi:hypothetical protein